jgi:hypothetical protein
MSRLLPTILLILAIACCCVFFGFDYRYSLTDNAQEKLETTTFSMGFPTMPWWSYEKTVVNGEETDSSFSFHLISLSWLFLLAAIALFALWRRAGRPPPEPMHHSTG